MSEVPQFRTTGEMFEYVGRRKDDIQRAVIPPGPNPALSYRGQQMAVMENVGMILELTDVRLVLRVDMAEALLNDGLLNRQRVPIQLFALPA